MRTLPDHLTISNRAEEAETQLARAERLVRMVRLLCDGDALGDESSVEINGMGEALDIAIEIINDGRDEPN